MPTAATDTFAANRLDPYKFPDKLREELVGFVASTTYAKGLVVGKVTASGLYAAYNDGLSNGVEVAKGILLYTIVVDASNNVSFADGSLGGGGKAAPIAVPGQGCLWKSADLAGMDAAGLADLQGSILSGDLTTGILVI